MNQPKQARSKKTSSPGSGSGFWDLLGLEVFGSEFPLGLLLMLVFGVFLLLYWLGKQAWQHAPAWKAALAKPAAQRNALLLVGAAVGLSLLALDFVPVHTLPLDSVRAALCITGVGMALFMQRSLYEHQR